MLPQISGEFRVGADPELRFTPSGVAVCELRAVASSRKKNEQDEWVDDKTCWLSMVGFKEQAENMAETFVKGNLIVAIGRLAIEEWEDKDGNKRQTPKLYVDQIGPAVKWDAAKVVKIERSGGPSGRGSGTPSSAPADDPWATGPTSDEPPF